MAKPHGDERRNPSRKKNAPLSPAQEEALDRTTQLPPAAPKPSAPPRKTHPRTRSIFKPRTKAPNFVLSVAVSTLRLLAIVLVCAGLAGLGALIGIAKAYVDTAPTLDLAALNAQDKTSFIYDSEGNLITDYKGTEDRIMVSIE